MSYIWRLLFKLSGWKVEGVIPSDIRKCIVVAAPHTSNWDFFYAIATGYLMNIKFNYLIKNEWMVFPLKTFFKKTGAIGVERQKNAKGMVSSLAEKIKAADELAIIIPPEGTRKSVKKWKTGFYQIALQANIPMALAYLDYKKKHSGIGKIVYPTGDYQKDLLQIQEFYRGITPRHPATYTVNIIPEIDLDFELTKKLAPEI